jgi:hypothetical protein
MFRILSSFSRHLVCIAAILSCILWVGSGSGSAQSNDSKCIRVTGFYEETATTNNCSSPVRLCTEYRYQGNLTADNFFTAATIVATADTPATGVVFATGDSVLTNVHVAGRRGTLIIKNAAVFHTAGEGELLDIQTIVGGTGELAGASGVTHSVGDFVNGAGSSVFDGFTCLP